MKGSKIVDSRMGFFSQRIEALDAPSSKPGDNCTFCVQQVQGTGDCLFHSIAISMAFADAAGAGDGWEEAGAPARAQRYKEGASALASSHLGLCAARCFGWSCQV